MVAFQVLESLAANRGVLAQFQHGLKVQLELNLQELGTPCAVETMSPLEVLELVRSALQAGPIQPSEAAMAVLREHAPEVCASFESEAERRRDQAALKAGVATLDVFIAAGRAAVAGKRKIPVFVRCIAEIVREAFLGGAPLDEQKALEKWRKTQRAVTRERKAMMATIFGTVMERRIEGYTLPEMAAEVDRSPSTVRELAASRGVRISRSVEVALLAGLTTPAKAAQFRQVADENDLKLTELVGFYLCAADLSAKNVQRLREKAGAPAPEPQRRIAARRPRPVSMSLARGTKA